ncbi:MAG: energy transducer TonB [Cyclobacteriaceae bacterium]|nr:energy transducer TonB [Cyclobacteriaceae bacterium]
MALELKKAAHADLANKQGLFFSIGLSVSLLATLGVFEWRQYEAPVVEIAGSGTTLFEELLEVPATEIPPPPPEVVIQQPRLVAVPDEQELKDELKFKIDIEVTEETRVQKAEIVEPPKVEEEKVDEIFTIVEVNAQPKGGLPAFYKYVAENIQYPVQAKRMGIQGRVFVEFVVNKDGTLTDVVAVKGIGAGCDEEAVRIVRNSPPWNPGRQRGHPVKQRMVVPITFKLAER